MSLVSLGLDFGEKRIGVAVTDEAGMMALPLDVIPFQGRRQVLDVLKKLIQDYRAGEIVVGLPKTMKNEIGPAAQKILEHVEWFRKHLETPIVLWDERLTTQEIERLLIEADMSRARRKEVRDQLAAQRILQTYLDHQKSRKT